MIQIANPHYDPAAPDYPVAILRGNKLLKDIELHFLHYKTFKQAAEKWNERKARLNMVNLYVIWTFMGMEKDESLYRRAENLPVEHKVFFVNHEINNEQYPHFFYIRGFEKNKGLGQLGEFMNLRGQRYYDQFDYVDWLNRGLIK